MIELYWGAAFHWIACGTQRKHGKHKENHTKLGKYLRDIGEPTVADWWDRLEEKRRGGMYGNHTAPLDVAEARRLWQAGLLQSREMSELAVKTAPDWRLAPPRSPPTRTGIGAGGGRLRGRRPFRRDFSRQPV